MLLKWLEIYTASLGNNAEFSLTVIFLEESIRWRRNAEQTSQWLYTVASVHDSKRKDQDERRLVTWK